LFDQSYPATIGMIVFALYLIIDIIFIEKVSGAMAIAGVFVCFPVFMMITAFSNMIGIGSASIISRELGKKNIEKVYPQDIINIRGNPDFRGREN